MVLYPTVTKLELMSPASFGDRHILIYAKDSCAPPSLTMHLTRQPICTFKACHLLSCTR
jgi:hypothetical protein